MVRRRNKEPRKYGPRSERVPAWIGWVGLAFYVAGWDLHPSTVTLSTGFAPTCDDERPKSGRGAPHGRKPAVLIWMYLTAHLMRLLPIKWDILRNPNSPLVVIQRKITG